ncbi:MAG: peptidylprolyl isomerase [Candidatus Hydrothermarchaeales archaeon]
MRKTFLLLVLVLLFAGCNVAGETVEVGDVVTVNYVGRLEDGKVFDTTVREVAENPVIPKTSTFTPRAVYTPFKFRVGAGEVIPGFEEGVIEMKEGEEKEIAIPPEKGYGNWSEKLTKTYPRIQTINIVEEVPMDELAEESGVTQFVKNTTIPWRYWKARILLITPDSVVLKNEVSDTIANTEIGPLEIKVGAGTITMTLTPSLDAVVNTNFGPARVSFINDTDFVLDYNHRLAGETLFFKVEVESIEKVST